MSLTKELGEGQFGKVFEASAAGLKAYGGRTKVVAVKFLSAAVDVKEQAVFIQEAIRMRDLEHAHVVQLLAVCFNTVPGFIVLEHMAKGDLKGVLQDSKDSGSPFGADELLEMGVQVGSALAYIAGKSFVHRDIAARNVLVDNENVLKLADFGLWCLMLGEMSDKHRTGTQHVPERGWLMLLM